MLNSASSLFVSLMFSPLSKLLAARQCRNKQLYMHVAYALKLPTVKSMLLENYDNFRMMHERWNAMESQIEKEMDEFSESAKGRPIRDIITRKAAAFPPSHMDFEPWKTTDSLKVDLDFLLSPSTFFECKCGDHVQYPSIFQHVHGWSASWKIEDFTFSVAVMSLAEALFASVQGQDSDFLNTEGLKVSQFQ